MDTNPAIFLFDLEASGKNVDIDRVIQVYAEAPDGETNFEGTLRLRRRSSVASIEVSILHTLTHPFQ